MLGLHQAFDLIGNIQVGEDSSVWFGCVIRSDVNEVKLGKTQIFKIYLVFIQIQIQKQLLETM